jgi:hypothetical protein
MRVCRRDGEWAAVIWYELRLKLKRRETVGRCMYVVGGERWTRQVECRRGHLYLSPVTGKGKREKGPGAQGKDARVLWICRYVMYVMYLVKEGQGHKFNS